MIDNEGLAFYFAEWIPIEGTGAQVLADGERQRFSRKWPQASGLQF